MQAPGIVCEMIDFSGPGYAMGWVVATFRLLAGATGSTANRVPTTPRPHANLILCEEGGLA